MICSRCAQHHNRMGQYLCARCHADSMIGYRERVKRRHASDFHPFDSYDPEELAHVRAAVADLEAA